MARSKKTLVNDITQLVVMINSFNADLLPASSPSKPIKNIPFGTKLNVIYKSNGYIYTSFDGINGFVKEIYVKEI